ncbi:MAG: Hsp20/alpha crystallin family protein [Bacteroidia bacterium]
MKAEAKKILLPSVLKSKWMNPFGGLFRNDFNNLDMSIPETIPSLNIKEEKDSYKVELAAPGLEKEDFNIQVEDSILTISCEKKSERNEINDGHFSRVEYNYSNFSRSLSLPENTDVSQMLAKYAKGILSMNIPKKRIAEKTAAQKINVE